ncbi:MAG TPA: sialidase family protein, partial [Thermoanaerobaculia bacterium]|nr:sialidase family protein [Thermoanaerobaculia bacterium]
RRGIALDIPNAWTIRRDTASTWLLERRARGTLVAALSIRIEDRRNHLEALKRVAEIELEYAAPTEFRNVRGRPVSERIARAPYKTPDEQEDPRDAPRARTTDLAWRETTAVVIDTAVVHLHAVVAPGASRRLAEEARDIGRTLRFPPGVSGEEDVRILRSGVLRPRLVWPASFAAGTTHGSASSGAPVQTNGGGEIETAISMDGQNILTVGACRMSYSTDGGTTFANSTVGSGAPSGLDGDCSITWAPSGTFYRSTLGTEFVALYASTDQGKSFSYVTTAVDRRAANINTDQPHIVADRWNTSASGKDLLYVVWQETFQYRSRITCSSDGGSTWSAPVDAFSGDFGYPRVAVGPDGMVYVASRSGTNITLEKFSGCEAGLVPQFGFPLSVTIRDVDCPVPGLDRCNNGNTLSSPTIAVDDRNPATVYLAYAQTTAMGNQNIIVMQSVDGGLTWPVSKSVVANANVTGVRFMPWIAAWNSVVYAGWYDRRDATAASNDLTSYYMNNVSVVSGTLTAGTEVDLSGVDDPQCASGWRCGVRNQADATGCSSQPQLAGFCGSNPGPRCDFNGPACAGGLQCITSWGCPKYGDYNGLAVGGGVLVNSWATSVPPGGGTPILPPRAWTVVTTVP